jgi:hypothetical protein
MSELEKVIYLMLLNLTRDQFKMVIAAADHEQMRRRKAQAREARRPRREGNVVYLARA